MTAVGVFDRFEKGLERAVNGAFAKAFRSEVEPVEIASALRKAADERAAVVGQGRTLVPNTFVVELGATDHDRLIDYAATLAEEFVANLEAYAEQQGYAFVGPVTVTFAEVPDLDTGVFRVQATTVEGRQSERRLAARPSPRATVASSQPAPAVPAIAAAAPGLVQPSRMRPWLDIDGQPYPLLSTTTVIGRGEDADIVLDDPGVSRSHAEVRVTTDGPHLVATIRDLGSTNGTFVDARRISAVQLDEGSAITVGRTRAIYRGAR
ncbi:MAG: FhaA domain-containing protein [Angustibacter sp.]